MVVITPSCTSEVMLLYNREKYKSRWKSLPREAPSLLVLGSHSAILFDTSSWIPSVLLFDLKSQEFSLRLMSFRENSAVRAVVLACCLDWGGLRQTKPIAVLGKSLKAH